MRYQRGDVVAFEVTGAAHYGILVVTEHGEPGWIEGPLISEQRLTPDQWPPVGTRLRGLVLGPGSLNRVRLCLRPVDGRPSPDHWPPVDAGSEGG